MAAIVASKVRKQRAAQQLAKDAEPTLGEDDKSKNQSNKVINS